MNPKLPARLLLIAFAATVLLLAPRLALSAGPSVSKVARALAVAIQKDDLDQVRTLLGELGRTDDDKATEVILKTLAQVPPHEVMEAAVDALVNLGAENVEKAFDKVMKRRPDPELAAVIVTVAARLDGEESTEWLVKALETREYFLYRNAIPPLVDRKSKEAIPALIDLLETIGYDPSTESYLVRDALIALTGQDLPSIEDWRNWWDANEKGFDPAKLDEGTGSTGVARKKPGEGYEIPKFFGVEVLSNHIVFVVDISGSMQWYDDTGEKIGEGPDHRTKMRLARLKHHLAQAVRNLPEYTHFRIIAFNDGTKTFPYKGFTTPATERAKREALEFVEGMQANGATHTDDALRKAFEDRNVDTIFLLSDGAPTRMGAKTKDLIEQIHVMAGKLNQLQKAKIFTFGFEGEPKFPPGLAPPPPPKDDEDAPTIQDLIDFLKKLAADHEGEYHAIK